MNAALEFTQFRPGLCECVCVVNHPDHIAICNAHVTTARVNDHPVCDTCIAEIGIHVGGPT